MKLDFSGIYPPIVTPFTKDGEVDYTALKHNIGELNHTALSGYVVLGSNGEYVYLSYEEKIAVMKSVVESSAEDKLVMAGTGCESTKETIRLSQDAKELGVDAVLLISPSYYPASSQEDEIINHYVRVVEEVDLPVFLYNVPKFTGVNLSPKIVARLSAYNNIVGIKDSSGNIAQLSEIIQTTPSDFNVFVGTASVLYSAITMGAKGGILALANIAPELSVEIMDSAKKGNHEKAKELQMRMLLVNKAVTATYGVPGLKHAMDLLGYKGGYPRLPLLPLAEEKKETLKELLREKGLLKG